MRPEQTGQKIPRQTLHNQRLSSHFTEDEGDSHDQSEGEDTISNLGTIGIENFDDEQSEHHEDEQNSIEHKAAGNSIDQTMDSPQHPYLYDGCAISAYSACLLIKSYTYCHQLSGQAHTNLLKLFQLVLPKPNTLPPSFAREKFSQIKQCTNTIVIDALLSYPIHNQPLHVQMQAVMRSFTGFQIISLLSSIQGSN